MAAHAPKRREPDIHDLPAEAFWRRLGAYNGTPPAVLANRELRDLIEPMLRADFSIVETAPPPTHRVSCPWTAIAGSDDLLAPPAEIEAWRPLADGPFELKTVAGDHFGTFNRPAATIDILRRRLAAFCS